MGKKKEAAKAEAKAAAKAQRKREKHAAAQAEAATSAPPTESGAGSEPGDRHPHLNHLDKVARLQAIATDEAAKPKARKAAKAELKRLREAGREMQAAKDARTPEEIDAEIRSRVQARRTEGDARLREMQHDVEQARLARHTETAPGEPLAAEAAEAEHPEAAEAEQPAPVDAAQAIDEAAHVAEAEAATFAKPSEAPKSDFDTNGNGQYIVKRPSDGRLVGYTRVTTYIDALEDKTTLTRWKMRILLEGVAAAETPDEAGKADPVSARVRDLVHNRDVAIAKARKQDRKGKLHPGQLATIVDATWGEFKRSLDKVADEIFELGGGREAATKGTDIHALCDLHDRDGIDAVQELLDAGEITPSDFADVEAYAAAMRAIGAEVIAAEQVIVNDDLKVAGRLDRVVMARLPEIRHPKTGEVIREADRTRKRYVADIKTGRVDYGAGKIAQQIRMYAESQGYDLNTHERAPLRTNRTTGLLIHVPAGTGTAHVHVVDLTLGAKGNRLAGEVRAFRSEGRRAIDLTTDLAKVATENGEEK